MSLKLLQTLVEIDSGHKDTDNILQCQELVVSELKELAFQNNFIPSEIKKEKVQFLASKKETLQSKKRVALLSHVDTVFGSRSKFHGFQQIDENRIQGPGVIDNKGGIVVLLEGLKRYLNNTTQNNLELSVFISPSEERGSPGFQNFMKSEGEKQDILCCFEPSLQGGHIVSSRSGNRWYQVVIDGVSAHSGRNFSQGVSALHDFLWRAQKIESLNDNEHGVSFSINKVKTPSARANMVCAQLEFIVDFRFATNELRDFYHEKILKILSAEGPQQSENNSFCSVKWSLIDDCPAFQMNQSAELYCQRYVEILSKELPSPIEHRQSKGASDACYFYNKNLVILDALGPCGDSMHKKGECLYVDSLEERIQAFAQFLNFLNQEA